MDNVYINILTDSLKEKLKILEEIEAVDDRETALLAEDNTDLKAFNENMDKKSVLIERLDRLDDGFEDTYSRVKAELGINKDKYRAEIKAMQELIGKISEKTVRIEAVEARNRETVQNKFRARRMELKGKRTSVKVANAYSDNMRRINKIDSFFVDKKK
ncbi:MAG: flagellar protein FlgN [Lachnospiraceae bacterium]|nr:flagellar protein FlgN [Lachnospiraceae bacterium]